MLVLFLNFKEEKSPISRALIGDLLVMQLQVLVGLEIQLAVVGHLSDQLQRQLLVGIEGVDGVTVALHGQVGIPTVGAHRLDLPVGLGDHLDGGAVPFLLDIPQQGQEVVEVTVDQDAGVLEDPVGRIQLGRELAALVRCRHVGDSVEEWDVGALGGDPHGQPVDVGARPVHLQDVGFLGLGQADWPVLVTKLAGAVRVKFSALVVVAQVVLGVEDRELAVRLHQERQFRGFRRLVRGLLRAEHLVANPNPGLTVDGVRPVRGPEDLTEVEGRRVRVEMVLVDKLLDAGVEHEVGAVGEVDLLDGQLVGDHGVGVVRDPLGNPVVAGPGLEVPGLVIVGEEDPVGFAGPVLGDQVTEPLDSFTRGLDVGEDDRDHGLLV